MGLADWLAFNKAFYSDTLFIEETAKTVALACYKTSVELAAEFGACEAYDTLHSDFWERMDLLLPETAKLRAETGIRNSMMTCTAPNTSTSLTMGSTASFLPPYQKQFFDESEDHTLDVVVKYEPDLYLTSFQMNQSFILNAAQSIQDWTDSGISMEFLFPKGASWSDNKAVSDLKIQSWRLGAKAIYYVRTAEPDEESICQMCAN
jgi:ribonucleoside-diphosphate reductase alpha chain